MSKKFRVIIPVRLESSRLPKKALRMIGNITMIERVVLQALKSEASEVIVATDSKEIENTLLSYSDKISIVMTSEAHQSGTDRIVEVIYKKRFSLNEVIVNVQGDEPFIAPETINQVAEILIHNKMYEYSTLYSNSSSIEEFFDKNIVKVVSTLKKRALYFSRSPIPMPKSDNQENFSFKKHIGIYAYRVSLLKRFATWKPSELENIESLEQLRCLEYDVYPLIEEATSGMHLGVDTLEDLNKANSTVLATQA